MASAYPKTLTYYAAARNPQGKVAQLFVTRVMAAPGVLAEPMRQEWTGVTYKSRRDAERDITRLNCQ